MRILRKTKGYSLCVACRAKGIVVLPPLADAGRTYRGAVLALALNRLRVVSRQVQFSETTTPRLLQYTLTIICHSPALVEHPRHCWHVPISINLKQKTDLLIPGNP